MNASKVIQRAVELHINPRKAMKYVESIESIARVRGDLAALQATIHIEIDPELKRQQEVDDWFDCQTKGRPATGTNETEQGCLDKYNHVYSIGSIPGDMAKENSPFASLLVASMDKARENTQTTSGGMHAQD